MSESVEISVTGDHLKKKRILRRIAIILLVLLVLLGCTFFIYAGIYYHAEDKAFSYIDNPAEGVTVDQSYKGQIAFIPAEDKFTGDGILFYPGGKVEYESYAPLMSMLASKGVLCVLIHMPFNLAIFDINAADGISAEYPQAERWYLAGHSLGGVAASMYISSHADEYNGLILCAAYSSSDLSNADIRILSMYGSEDKVLNMDSYSKSRKNLPENFTEHIIQGGCHSYFGCYGLQDGDGTPAVTREEQWNEAAETIISWIEQ